MRVTAFDGTRLQQGTGWNDTAVSHYILTGSAKGLTTNDTCHWRAGALLRPTTSPFHLSGRWIAQPWRR